ncbi:MAG: hypothetical protein HWN68_14990 [Desulfobacterales bacterium]|nr:hypothetical protein [Desulfobacterales bacterium]
MNWTAWMMRLMPNLVASVSPPLRTKLVNFAKSFYDDAKKSENPWDHFIAEVINWAVGINV